MSLLGHDNVTLVDLTEALPSSLSLSSSLSTNVQMVGPDGSYTPDFTTDEVIITPSFFIGSTEIPVANYLNLIYYHCGEMDGNQEKDIAYDASIFDSDGALIDETTSIYVDSLAQLHYRKNLIQNIEIEAFISGFIYNNITYPLARTINPINILRLEYNDETYSAFMTTEDGREHFEEGQENDITLVAQIYQGAQEVSNVTYTWYQVGSSGLEKLPNTTKTLTVARGQIDSTGTFICDITVPNGTVYRVSKTLTDRTDSYFGTISANSSLILTPEHSTITLTNQIWHRTSIINDPDSSRFTYSWSCIDEDNQVVQLTGVTTDEKSLVVDINGAFPKKDLVIYCEATIDGKAVTNSYISLSYSPITYSVYVEPRTIFVPANANGSYRGETSFSKEIKFQLLNNAKEPLTFGEEDTAPSLVTNPIFAATVTQVTAGKWDYLITLTIQDAAQFQNGFSDSYSLAFTYEYLGVAFSEEVEAIKNISGSGGEEGSGYTVILTNESFVFPANNSAAIAGAQATTSVIVFMNTTPLAATITSINNIPVSGDTLNNSGLISNMDVTITGNGTTSPQITFAARSALTDSGTIPIIISISGVSFTKIWSYSLAFRGVDGSDGTNGADGRTYSVIANSDYIVYQVKNGVPSMTPTTLTLNAYTYVGVSTVPTPFSGGTLAFFGRNVYNSWVELNSIAGSTLSVNLNQTNFYPYKEFKYQLRTEDYILDEQTIPVLRDGVLNGGRNLIIGSDNTWTRDFDDTGKLEFSLNVTRNIAYSEYQGQYLTLSFDRVFSPTAATMCTDVDDADKDEDGNAPFGALVRVTWSNGSDGQVIHEYCATNYHPDMTENNAQRYMTTDWIEPPETGYSISLVEVVIQLAYYPSSSGTIFSITRPQLEFGFEAGVWTIAPEDLSLETIKGLNLITNSYRYSVDSSIALYNSIEIPADDDYTLSWQNVERAPIITENELITVEVVDATDSVLSTQNITAFNSPGSMLFENLSMGQFIRIYCGNKATITVSDNSIITFTQIKLERGRNATSWLASDSDIIQIVQQIQEDTANEIGAASDAVLNIIQEDGTIVRTTMDDWQSLLSTNSYFVGGDNQDTPNFEALKSYANFYHATYQEGYGAYLERISSGIDLGYETDGTPYLTLSTNSYSSGEFSMRLTNTQLGFYKDGKALAWFSSSKMFIPVALVRDQLIIGSNDFGGISFIPTSSGIAVTWIDGGDAVFEEG